MRNEATVNKAELQQVKDLIQTAVARLTVLLADLGCTHANSISVTTMGPDNTNKFLCPDCGETIEEEITYEF